MERVAAANDGIRDEATVEGCELAPMRHSENQKIGIGDLSWTEQSRKIDSRMIDQADIVGPEFMVAG